MRRLLVILRFFSSWTSSRWILIVSLTSRKLSRATGRESKAWSGILRTVEAPADIILIGILHHTLPRPIAVMATPTVTAALTAQGTEYPLSLKTAKRG